MVAQLKPVNLTFVAKVSSISGGLYVRIPKRLADYLGIEKGVQVVVQVVDVKREESP